MQQKEMNYLEWTRHFSTDAACLVEIARHHWPSGFLCSRCGHDHAFVLSRGQKRQCAHCRYQVSVIAGTIFHHTHVPLTKWFAAIHLIASDKGGVTALRLSKLMGVSWQTASRMLRLLRRAMHDRDRSYWQSELVEIDDALVGGYRAGNRGRGAEGKTPVLLAVEKRGEGTGFLAAQVMAQGLNQDAVHEFSRRNLAPAISIRTDALPALTSLGEQHNHCARVTPAKQANQWLPKVHLIIANLKQFLLGTFHSASRNYLQEYIDEFVYRFNRRHREHQLPQRLLEAAVAHVPVRLDAT